MNRASENRERQEFQVVESLSSKDQSMISRERNTSENNMEIYSGFHRELDNMDRGHEDK